MEDASLEVRTFEEVGCSRASKMVRIEEESCPAFMVKVTVISRGMQISTPLSCQAEGLALLLGCDGTRDFLAPAVHTRYAATYV